MLNMAVFVSGQGSNLQAIINAIKKHKIKANLSLVLSDNKNAYALKRAKRAKLKTVVIDPQPFKASEPFDSEVIKYLEEEKIDLIVLAGFMRILSPSLIAKYPNKILNIHPALLPSFKGAQAIKDAFDYGVKITGVTVHFVDEKMDHGPVILQGTVKIKDSDTLESLEAKIHKLEHKLYPQVIRLLIEGKINVEGRKVRIA